MHTTLRVTGLAVLTSLVACGGAKRGESAPPADTAIPSPATTVSRPIVLLCGTDTISVTGAPADTLQLYVHGESFTVTLVPSASGARYQAGTDTSTFYWNQGNQALVLIHGDALPPCEPVPGT